ncbi:copper homeostasis periplasmic binding protein CopC [Frateuria aurantia]
MSRYRSVLLGLSAASALLVSVTASAHANLLAVTPADHSVGPAPAHIDLSFSEKLLEPVSGADLVLTAMPGMSMGPTKVPATVSFSADAKGLSVTPARPLVPGSYRLDWHVISADTHPRKGSVSFQVK